MSQGKIFKNVQMTHRKAKERNRRMRSRENKYKTTDRVET